MIVTFKLVDTWVWPAPRLQLRNDISIAGAVDTFTEWFHSQSQSLSRGLELTQNVNCRVEPVGSLRPLTNWTTQVLPLPAVRYYISSHARITTRRPHPPWGRSGQTIFCIRFASPINPAGCLLFTPISIRLGGSKTFWPRSVVSYYETSHFFVSRSVDLYLHIHESYYTCTYTCIRMWTCMHMWSASVWYHWCVITQIHSSSFLYQRCYDAGKP